MWLLYLFLQKGKAYENKREILIDKMCNFFQAHNELKVILAEICPSPSTSPKIFDLRVPWDKDNTQSSQQNFIETNREWSSL